MRAYRFVLALLALALPLPAPADDIIRDLPTGQSARFEHMDPRPLPPLRVLDEQGHMVDLDTFRGDVMLLTFWATWCPSCKPEMPVLDRMARRYVRAGLRILPISIDKQGPGVVRSFYLKNDLTRLPILLAGQPGMVREFGMRMIPSSVLVNRRGEVVGRFPGAVNWDDTQVRSVLEYELRQPNPNRDSP